MLIQGHCPLWSVCVCNNVITTILYVRMEIAYTWKYTEGIFAGYPSTCSVVRRVSVRKLV